MADIKTINAVPVVGIKTYQNILLADVKTINALTIGAPVVEPPVGLPVTANLQSWYTAGQGAMSRSAGSFVRANGEYLSAPSNASLQTPGAFTIGGWHYATSITGADVSLAKRDNAIVDYQIYNATANTYMTASAVAGGFPAALGPPMPVNEWHFLIAWFDPVAGPSGTLYIQIDDGVVNSGASGPLVSTTHPFGIGGGQVGGPYSWDGRLQNMFVFRRMLTATERTFLYNSGNGRRFEELDTAFKTDLGGWWPCDEISGSRRDVSGNSNTLTDNNTVTEADGKVLNAVGEGVRVYEWRDQGPHGMHISQAIIARRPIYVASGRNGNPVLNFSNSYLFVPAVPTAGLPIAPDAGNAWAVGEHTGGGNAYILNWNPDGTHQFLMINLSGTWYYDHGPWTAARASGAAPTTWGLIENYRASTVMELRRNNTTIGSFASSAGSVLPALIHSWDVGNVEAMNTPWNGPIGEIAIYDIGLSAADRTLMRDYFNTKYALGF